MYMTGSKEYVEAVRAERYAPHSRTAPPARMTGIRSIERVVKMVGRGKETAPQPRAA